MRKWATVGNPMTVLLLLAFGYLSLVVVMFLAQDRLLYFPGGVDLRHAALAGLEPWPSDEAHLGFVSSTPPEPVRGTFLVWHGNAGSAVDRVYYTRALERRGFRVVLLEYPGYGAREGRPGEEAFVTEAVRATRLATERFTEPLYLLGESMGCAVATAVAAAEADVVAGLVLITPWANLPDLAQAKYPFVPARWLVRDRYDNVRNLRDYAGPIAVAMCEGDEVVPNRHTKRLYESVESPKRLWVFPEADHNSWPVGREEPWWDEVLDFVTNRSAPGAPQDERAPAGDGAP